MPMTGDVSHDSGPHAVVSIAAPYGRACTNCSRAKCKCILRPVGGACERCHRLGKTCQPSNPLRKRSKKPRSSRTAQLEEKLDGLVTLLRQSGRPNLAADVGVEINDMRPVSVPAVAPAATSLTPERKQQLEMEDVCRGYAPASCAGTEPSGDAAAAEAEAGAGTGAARGTSLPTPTQTASPEGSGGHGDDILPTPDEAEALFETFRGHYLQRLPIFHFRSTMTARQLRAEKPFLWLCIMTVASRSTSQQLALGQRVRQIVSQKLVVENERSMDYLLGILAVLGWANHLLGNKPFMCMFCQLAIGLLFDLGLTRDPLDGANPFTCWKAAQERAERNRATAQSLLVKSQMLRTMEQRRAVVALYMISSAVAGFMGKMDSLRWTPHMDECLDVLDRQPEVPLDRALVALVRMQLLNEEANRLSWRPEVPHESSDAPRTPPPIYVKLLQGQLQRMVQSLPPEVHNIDAVISQIHCTKLSIQEIALSTWMGSSVPPNLHDVARLDVLYACLHAVKAWFDHFFTVPPAAYRTVPLLFFTQLSHCVLALYQLSILEDPVWDRASVRNTIDLISTLDEIADRFMRVCTETGLDAQVDEHNMFTKAVKTLRGVKVTWESALAPLQAPANANASGLGPGVPPGPGGVGEVEIGQFGMDFMDNRWFADFFTPFDF